MSETLKEIACDLCGSDKKVYVKTENGFPISRCKNCSFVYVNCIPPIEDGKVIGEYYQGTEQEIASSKAGYEKVSQFLLNELRRLRPQTGTLLDVGCGYGFFLQEAQKNGWQVFGTELSHIAVNYAREKQNLPNVFFSDLSDIQFSVNKFDAINLTNVLEHVPSPTQILENCYNRMAPNSVLLIRVPNIDFYHFKERFNSILESIGLVKGGALCYLASPPPYHLSRFTPQTIKKYFTKTGFETVEVKPSKLSAAAEENLIYRAFEMFVQILFKISFRRINLTPTMLAIGVKKGSPSATKASN
jgi:2-polyprenyl-3-methyl-5-hydroxy-6-metoxy-1,4-benzoquinol methylase